VSPPPQSPSPSPSAATIGQPADDGARIVAVQALGDRLRDLTIDSPAVGTVTVRLLLPATFTDQPTTRFPVLYLLHGGSGEYTDWTLNTSVEAFTARTNLLVVMPAASTSGIDGWYADWKSSGGVVDPPLWETFHLVELRQLLERNWQAGEDRAVAGLSMGGYGAVTYAGRHPDMFKAVASFSGALDLRGRWERFDDPLEIQRYGDPVADAANWDSHDPMKLVPELKGMAVYISYGNGQPGPLDAEGTDVDDIEVWIGEGNARFVDALEQEGIPATVNDYGPGTHSWTYWERELRAALPMLLGALGEGA
jgi:S-formylglutathione hydrolase FrmB